MPKRKRDLLNLPEGAKEDVKTMKGLIEKYSEKLEELGEEVFSWAKKHKVLIALATIAVLFWRYWLAEEKEEDY